MYVCFSLCLCCLCSDAKLYVFEARRKTHFAGMMAGGWGKGIKYKAQRFTVIAVLLPADTDIDGAALTRRDSLWRCGGVTAVTQTLFIRSTGPGWLRVFPRWPARLH